MLNHIIALLVLALLSGCSTAQLYTVSTSLIVADYAQTHDITHRADREELNPILGKNPTGGEVRTYFATALIGHSLLATYLPDRRKKEYLWMVTIVQGAVVLHNMKMGMDFRF